MNKLQAGGTAKWQSALPWKYAFSLAICIIGAFSAKAQTGIEGKWKDHKNGSVILIYEEGGKYFGQLVGSDNPKTNSKIQSQDQKMVVLKDFKKESETQFCCGTIYQPKSKRTISATLTLDKNNLKIDGSYNGFSGSQTWTRL